MFRKGTDKQPGGVRLLADYAASPLSDGSVIIVTHSALLFRDHYEAQVRGLTSFSAADLWVLSMGGLRGGELNVASEKWRRGG